jgi:chemotaxis protein MotB
MAGDSKKLQPIIIKRVKKGGHARHGGAWKIAYADFVTAMMAFFLLMWLLGSTTEGDRKGIAEFFNAPLKVSFVGGSGSGDSSHVIRGGGADLTRSSGQVKQGEIKAPRKTISLQALQAEQKRVEMAKLEGLKQKVEELLSSNPRLAAMKSQIRLDMTRDGLRIQIVDEQNRAMFDSGSAVVKPYMRELLRDIGEVLADVPNRITLEGHTDAQPFIGGQRGYSNWELSSDRANASRRELVIGGLPEDRLLLVQGLASSSPFDSADLHSPANRRISIIVMNQEAEERILGRLGSQNSKAAGAPKARVSTASKPSILQRRRAETLRVPAMSEDADLKFLIVDDFSTMRRVMRALLKEIGFERSEAAEDGGVALEMLRKSKFDFIITDILMPNMNGFELLTAIKADDTLKHLPVLMVTAEARKDDIVRSMQAGAAGCIVKPFTRNTLEERVRKILGKQAATA